MGNDDRQQNIHVAIGMASEVEDSKGKFPTKWRGGGPYNSAIGLTIYVTKPLNW